VRWSSWPASFWARFSPTLIAILLSHVRSPLHGRTVGLFFAYGGIGWTPFPSLIGAYAKRTSVQHAIPDRHSVRDDSDRAVRGAPANVTEFNAVSGNGRNGYSCGSACAEVVSGKITTARRNLNCCQFRWDCSMDWKFDRKMEELNFGNSNLGAPDVTYSKRHFFLQIRTATGH